MLKKLFLPEQSAKIPGLKIEVLFNPFALM